jgi:hypothetical protein
MANYYYLSDLSTTYVFDTNAWSIDLGMPKRNWKIDKNAGCHGGILRGMGYYEDRTIKIEMKFRGSGATTFDSIRNTFLTWINKAHWQTLYFYVVFADGTTTTRAQCFPSPSGGEKYKYIKISESMSYLFNCPDPFFYNVTPNTTGSPLAITSATEQTQAVTNAGNIDCPIKCKFTPTGNETFFQVKIAEDYGFRLEGSFLAGVQIIYDTADGSMTIGGTEVQASQYLADGTEFNILPGANSLYILCSGAGSFAWEFSERYV